MTDDTWLAGVDGCKGGWITAFENSITGEVRVRVIPRFIDIFDADERPSIVVVDMPIGLPGLGEQGGRQAEREAREFLKRRKSSVFPMPSRAALMQEDYAEAKRVAEATSKAPGRRSMPIQTFCIAPCIREIDAVLRASSEMAERVFETHPEVAFQLMKGGGLDEPKKKKNRVWHAGAEERRLLLRAQGISEIFNAPVPRGAREDDRLDALAALVVARRIRAGIARSFPETPPRDAFGLRMAIWA